MGVGREGGVCGVVGLEAAVGEGLAWGLVSVLGVRVLFVQGRGTGRTDG